MELPIDDANRAALMEWVRAGGAFVGIHCATDTWYEFAPYMELMGGAFDGHPWTEMVGVLVEDGRHPATRHLGERFEIDDEIYQFRDFTRDPVRVLLSLDPESVDAAKGKHDDYPIAWCRDWGEGRVFYTSLGHRPEVWNDQRFLTHLLGGLRWAIEGPEHVAALPEGAKLLLSSDRTGGWYHKGTRAVFGWKRAKGAVEIVPGVGDLITEEEFGDFLLHVEFAVPEGGNSGVYLHGNYEVQVYDSYGEVKLLPGYCGGIYGLKAADAIASREPGRWQSFDIRFRAPRITNAGGKTANARVSVWHNGLLVHDDVELPGPTPGSLDGQEYQRGPLLLQDHGDPVLYRNVWILPLDDE